MDKIITILFIFFTFLITIFSLTSIVIIDNSLKWREYYEYINIKGEKGRAPYCFTIEEQKYCRDTISRFKVIKYIEKKERR